MIRIGVQLSGLERTLLESAQASNAVTAPSTILAESERIVRAHGDASSQPGKLAPQLASFSADLEHVDAVSRLAAESQLTLDLIRTQIGKISVALREENSHSIDAALFEIDNLARVEVDGRRILDGSFDYQTCGPIQFPIREEGIRPNLTTAQLGGPTGVLADLRSSGRFGNLDQNRSFAILVVDEAFAELTMIEDRIDSFADNAFALSAAVLSDLTTLEDSFDGVPAEDESLLHEKNRQLSDKILASLEALSDQRAKITQLIERMASLD
ncbi:hypothetical protein LOC68_17755 [Blastopirellula sp. JC732]|uniref:Flagellin N-terminal domain-containing protein n=1 Tax=Blastopirellula sediminis TaxID=2894196 RepID=A0A9X1MN36_9BACT|nr:hypothetical protein [Blastopirellula sediminis]MCC9606459.1 hypothetical protein [Blastopirellula sediminis]MCC9630243.1 hypothetical protein [Blastopirellula sediminis]